MLEIFIQLEKAVKSTVPVIDKELPVLTSTEWNILKELCQVLKPFKDAENLKWRKVLYCCLSNTSFLMVLIVVLQLQVINNYLYILH